MSFTPDEVRRLVSGDGDAWLNGRPVWRNINDTWRGEVAVWANHLDIGEAAFWLMTTTRTTQPSFVLVIRGASCRRLDVNRPHRHLAGTHIQGRDAPDDQEFAQDAAGMFPPIPAKGTVEGEQYASTFIAFAEYLGIGRGTFEWVNPPDGRPS